MNPSLWPTGLTLGTCPPSGQDRSDFALLCGIQHLEWWMHRRSHSPNWASASLTTGTLLALLRRAGSLERLHGSPHAHRPVVVRVAETAQHLERQARFNVGEAGGEAGGAGHPEERGPGLGEPADPRDVAGPERIDEGGEPNHIPTAYLTPTTFGHVSTSSCNIGADTTGSLMYRTTGISASADAIARWYATQPPDDWWGCSG